MDEWLQSQIANGLPDFAGTTISGTIAVRDDLATELLNRWLAQQRHPPSPTKGVQINAILPHVKRTEIRAEAGRVLIDFAIAVEAEAHKS